MKCRLREDEETHFPKKAALLGSGFFREVQILFFIGSELTFTGFCPLRQMTEQLSGLIQERYGRTREEADREVKDFFDKNRGPY